MKKFNLQDALAGKPVTTRSGIKVDQIAYFPKRVVYPLVVHLEDYDSVYQTDVRGVPKPVKFPYVTRQREDYELVMVTTKRTVYVNVYGGRNAAGWFETQHEAEANAKDNLSPILARAVPILIED